MVMGIRIGPCAWRNCISAAGIGIGIRIEERAGWVRVRVRHASFGVDKRAVEDAWEAASDRI